MLPCDERRSPLLPGKPHGCSIVAKPPGINGRKEGVNPHGPLRVDSPPRGLNFRFGKPAVPTGADRGILV
jgi:hypothetical protein